MTNLELAILDRVINHSARQMGAAEMSNKEGSNLSWKYYQGAYESLVKLRTELLGLDQPINITPCS